MIDDASTFALPFVRNYSQFLQLNNAGHVAAQDIGSAGGNFKTFVRLWHLDGTFVKVAEAGTELQTKIVTVNLFDSIPVLGQIDFFNLQLVTFVTRPLPHDVVGLPSLNNRGAVAFMATGGTANNLMTRLMYTADGETIALQELPGSALQIRSSISDDGKVVARAGTTAMVPILLYQKSHPPVMVAGDTAGFRAAGAAPSISDDGRIIAFHGDLTAAGAGHWTTANQGVVPIPLSAGPGVFAFVFVGDRQYLVRIAGENPNGGGAMAPGVRRLPGDANVTGPDLNLDDEADWNIAAIDPDSRISVSSIRVFANPEKGGGMPPLSIRAQTPWTAVRRQSSAVG